MNTIEPAKRNEQTVELGRRAYVTGSQLMNLVDQMTSLGWQPDGYTPQEIAELGKALQGMAIRCAMDASNTELLTELTGRQAREPEVS